MALGVDDMRAGRVVLKTTLLTLGTLGFVVCLALIFESMRSVMDVGGSCASGGPYAISRPCPQGVAWIMPVSIFGMLFFVAISFVGVFSRGGPRPYAFAWSALFLALGWNFLEYGFDPSGGGTSASWLVCGFVFVAMGGVPLLFLFAKGAARWAFWGPRTERSDDLLRPYHPPPATPDPALRAAGGLVPPPATVPGTPRPDPPPDPSQVRSRGPSRPDVVERLATLADLHARNLLDEREYEIAKNAVLHDEEAEP